MNTPFVSIHCLAYNHAPFIRRCLDGFIMQKTNFPIEVLIHDDASTDGTTDIIREYESKYPEIIKPIYQTENQYSKGVRISLTYNYPRVKGRYLALCEGDDYWTDEYKLQKQVDFLEANEDFSICFHPVELYDETEEEYILNNTVSDVPEITDIKTLAIGNYINTLSVMYRTNKKVFEDIEKLPKTSNNDYILHMLYAEYGKIKKIPDVMGVYRKHDGGISSKKSAQENYTKWKGTLTALLIHYFNKQDVISILIEQYKKVNYILNQKKSENISNICALYINTGNGYSEENKQYYSFTGNKADIYFKIPDNAISLRFDLCESYGYAINNFKVYSKFDNVKYILQNCYEDKNKNIIYKDTYPKIEIQCAKEWINIKYNINISSQYHQNEFYNYFVATCDELNKFITDQQEHIEYKNNEMKKLNDSLNWHINYVKQQNIEKENLLESLNWHINCVKQQNIEKENLLESLNWYTNFIQYLQKHIEYKNIKMEELRKNIDWYTKLLNKI